MSSMGSIRMPMIDEVFSGFSAEDLTMEKYAGGMQMKRWIGAMLLMALCTLSTVPAMAAPPKVQETIFQWVQSSSRANYYFNKQQICYAVDDKGMIDMNTLIVPTLKTYDDVQIQDTIDKRRWKMLPMAGFDDLVGEAEYLRFDIARQTVTTVEQDYLDSTWSPLEQNMTAQETELAKLPEKSWDRSFYRAILDYAAKHADEIAAHTKGTLKPADKKKLEEQKKAAAKELLAQLKREQQTKK